MISVCIGTSDGLSIACNTYATSFDPSIVSHIIFYYYKQYVWSVFWIANAAAAAVNFILLFCAFYAAIAHTAAFVFTWYNMVSDIQ